jgi:hypothetical protein
MRGAPASSSSIRGELVVNAQRQPVGGAWTELWRRVLFGADEQTADGVGPPGAEDTLGAQPIRPASADQPLPTVVRNAVDHGFETDDERAARGKPAYNRLRASANIEGATSAALSPRGRAAL